MQRCTTFALDACARHSLSTIHGLSRRNDAPNGNIGALGMMVVSRPKNAAVALNNICGYCVCDGAGNTGPRASTPVDGSYHRTVSVMLGMYGSYERSLCSQNGTSCAAR